MKFIVTAGGQGTKLWPYSREEKPKHFQPMLKDKSLFTYNIELLLSSYTPRDVFVSTKRRYLKYALEQAPQIPLENYIVEPDIKKNRGPAEGLAFLKLSLVHPDEPFMIIQADCVRSPEKEFLKMVKATEELVKRDKKLVTGGIKATSPILGVDFLRLGKQVDSESGLDIFTVDKFVERLSDYKKTKQLVESFHITTHCNHNCWYPELMLDAYKKYRPDWYKSLMEIRDVFGKDTEDKEVMEIFSKMEAGPTEEVTKNVFEDGYVILVPYRWTDIGTWNSLHEYYSEDGGSYADDNVLAIETRSSLIKGGNSTKLIATYGIENLIVVDTEDALLIIPKDKIDKIKDIREKLREDPKLAVYL